MWKSGTTVTSLNPTLQTSQPLKMKLDSKIWQKETCPKISCENELQSQCEPFSHDWASAVAASLAALDACAGVFKFGPRRGGGDTNVVESSQMVWWCLHAAVLFPFFGCICISSGFGILHKAPWSHFSSEMERPNSDNFSESEFFSVYCSQLFQRPFFSKSLHFFAGPMQKHVCLPMRRTKHGRFE